jgi:hypothetical protein
MEEMAQPLPHHAQMHHFMQSVLGSGHVLRCPRVTSLGEGKEYGDFALFLQSSPIGRLLMRIVNYWHRTARQWLFLVGKCGLQGKLKGVSVWFR